MLVFSSLFLLGCDGGAPTTDVPTDAPDTDVDTDTDPGIPTPEPNGFLTGELCLVRTVFETSCVTGCHSAIVQGGDLDLQTDPYTALINRPSRLGGNLQLVTPGNKIDSFLYRKMVGLIADTEGTVMPPVALLDPFVGELVGNWIERGAINDCNLQPPGGDPPPPPPPPPPPTVPVVGPHHPPDWALAQNHGVAANLQTDGDCRSCHGATLQGDGNAASCDQCHQVGWRTDCTLCHGGTENASGAPPKDVDGVINPNLISFTTHTAHIEEGYTCVQCHYVPTDYLTNGHVFGDVTPGYGEVNYAGGLSAVATYYGGQCSNTYCHGNGRADNGTISDADGPLGCTSCHANLASPPPDWTLMSGLHGLHLNEGSQCYECHGTTVNNANNIIAPNQHINRQNELYNPNMTAMGATCTGTCHGYNHQNRGW